jgi:hypothetical protein
MSDYDRDLEKPSPAARHNLTVRSDPSRAQVWAWNSSAQTTSVVPSYHNLQKSAALFQKPSTSPMEDAAADLSADTMELAPTVRAHRPHRRSHPRRQGQAQAQSKGEEGADRGKEGGPKPKAAWPSGRRAGKEGRDLN